VRNACKQQKVLKVVLDLKMHIEYLAIACVVVMNIYT